jgi:hypothetical protein
LDVVRESVPSTLQRANFQSIQSETNYMPFKPNYGLQLADRNRTAQARSEEKREERKKPRNAVPNA